MIDPDIKNGYQIDGSTCRDAGFIFTPVDVCEMNPYMLMSLESCLPKDSIPACDAGPGANDFMDCLVYLNLKPISGKFGTIPWSTTSSLDLGAFYLEDDELTVTIVAADS